MQIGGHRNNCVSSHEKIVGQVRVLVVEDEASLREQLIRALTEWGLVATGASNGELAVQRTAAEPFDVAVLDLSLPGIDGIETLARLRTRTPNLQGIILTGSATVPAAQKAIRLGIVEFLTKPCNRGELEQAMDRARRRLQHGLPILLPEDPAARNWADVEREHIMAALDRNGGERALTAKELGISRKTLYNKLKGYVRQRFSS